MRKCLKSLLMAIKCHFNPILTNIINMGKIKEYYHEEIIAMTKQNQSKQKDDDYQYQQYIESLSQNTSKLLSD